MKRIAEATAGEVYKGRRPTVNADGGGTLRPYGLGKQGLRGTSGLDVLVSTEVLPRRCSASQSYRLLSIGSLKNENSMRPRCCLLADV